MAVRATGIRAKLNLGLGSVLLVATLAFGVSYAWLERTTALESNRRHLAQVASLVRAQLETAQGEETITATLEEFARQLGEAAGSRHDLTLRAEDGRILATSQPAPSAEPTGLEAEPEPGPFLAALFPASLRVTVPLTLESDEGRGALAAQLTLEEPLSELPGHVIASLLRHIAFAAGLVGLALGSAAWIVDRLVVRPLRQLANATEEIARGDEWEPRLPEGRRTDEIGALTDCLAQMSRQLRESLRRERYGSAHLVAVRIRRELDEPLREIQMRLAMLEKLLPDESEEARVCGELASSLEEITEIRHRLLEVSASPG